MPVYKDILTKANLLSDSYRFKEVDGVVYECDCKMVKKRGEVFDVGGAPTVEADDMPEEEGSETVIDIPDFFNYQPISLEKRDYADHMRSYIREVTERMQSQNKTQSEIDDFKQKISEYSREKVIPNFKNYEFFTCGWTKEVEGMVVLMDYREDGTTPYLTLWKHGMEEVRA